MCVWFWTFVDVAVVATTRVEKKVDSTFLAPPEGNMTFLGGSNWCVASPSASQADLQNALDWACGLGMTDCNQIRPGGPCYQPDTLFSHASYAFNSYYQQNGNSDVACNFGGAATLTKNNPSKFISVVKLVNHKLNWTELNGNLFNVLSMTGYGKCVYAASE